MGHIPGMDIPEEALLVLTSRKACLDILFIISVLLCGLVMFFMYCMYSFVEIYFPKHFSIHLVSRIRCFENSFVTKPNHCVSLRRTGSDIPDEASLDAVSVVSEEITRVMQVVNQSGPFL